MRPALVRAWILVVLAALASQAASAADWPQWRGPRRDGVASGVKLPRDLPESLAEGWSIEVGSGHSSPLVVGERVYTFGRQGDSEAVAAYELAGGKRIWRSEYRAPYKVNPVAASHGSGPKATAVVAAGRMVTLGINGVLTCWDIADGRRVWQHEFGKQFKSTAPLYGTAASPLVVDGLCVAFVGGHDSGALAAFELEGGKQKWAWDEDGPGYASAVVAQVAGRPQLVTQSQTATIGLDPSNGRLLWKLPFQTEYDQNCVTPLVVGQRLLVSGLKKGLQCYQWPAQSQGPPSLAWETADVSFYMSSPVLLGDLVVGFSHLKRGQLCAVRLADGKLAWTGEARQGDNAALVVERERVWMLTNAGRLSAWAWRSDHLHKLADYAVARSPTWAHPALTDAGVLVKDETSLRLWRWK